MGHWYWIGVSAGIGVAIGTLVVGVLAGSRTLRVIALIAAGGLGVLVGYALGDWQERLAGGAGGILGGLGSAQVASGTLRRGGTRVGTALIFGAAAIVLTGLAWIPGVGYLEATVVPALAARLRGRMPERYAGLRSLARD